jgi:hypothetical protein
MPNVKRGKDEVSTAANSYSDAVSKQMSDKLQFVAQFDKLKLVGHQTASLSNFVSSLRDEEAQTWL